MCLDSRLWLVLQQQTAMPESADTGTKMWCNYRCEESLVRFEAWQGVAVKTMEAGAAQVAQLKQAVQEKSEQLASVQAECEGLQARQCTVVLCTCFNATCSIG